MTPQERDLLANLVSRLRQSPTQQLDAEADQVINDLVRERPDTPYTLAQTVLIQDYALNQAQARIADLEDQVKGQPQESGGFLSAIFGSSKPTQQPQPQYQQQTYQAPPPGYGQPAAGPWGSAAPQVFGQGSGQPSFLRSAATTAAGIAGGALLFQGIQSLFGGHGMGYGGFGPAGFGGGFTPQPGITETVVNNYYDTPGPGTEHAGTQHAGFDQGSYDQASFDQSGNDSGFTDVGFDDNGGGDFGGDDV